MYGLTPEFVSLCFCIPSLIYAASSPLLFLITQRVPKRLVIIFGHILCAIGMSIVGSSKFFGLENDANMVLAGLCVLGLSASLIAIPVMPECLEAIEDRIDFNYNPEDVNNLISGIFVTSTGVGETIGPIASSLLNKYFGFNLAQDYFAMFVISYAMMYIFMGGGRKILRSTATEKFKRQLSA